MSPILAFLLSLPPFPLTPDPSLCFDQLVDNADDRI
jgi:hypothetical protein